MTQRYFVSEVSVGEAGLTARPAVCDRVNPSDPRHARVVEVFRSNERDAAERLAAQMNRQLP